MRLSGAAASQVTDDGMHRQLMPAPEPNDQRWEQDGPMGNSVIMNSDEHRKNDLLVRNDALRDHVRQFGMGSLL